MLKGAIALFGAGKKLASTQAKTIASQVKELFTPEDSIGSLGPSMSTKEKTMSQDAKPNVKTDTAQATSPSKSEIETRAYELWEAAGSPDGQSDQFWSEAEKELTAKVS